MAENSMNNFMTVLGFVNGMIGGTILLLPLLGIKTGYISSPIICLVVGLIQFYACYLLVLHIGKSKSFKESVLAHSQNNYTYVKIYSFMFWIYFVPLFFIYFRLIVLQFQGLFGDSPLIAPLSAIVLFSIIVLIRIYKIGEETLAYGITSIITYVIFLIWAQMTAPQGEKQVQPFGDAFELSSTLMLAYSVSNVVSENIFKNKNRPDFLKLIGYTFFWGIIIYTFITFGSFAIVNRVPFKKNPETIEDYFQQGGWQIAVIEILYVVHLFSAFPNFTIISKIRFYELIEVELKDKVAWHEIAYIFITILASLLIYLSGIHLDTMVQINGSIFGYITAIIIPFFIHLKCVHIDKSSGTIKNDHEHNKEIIQNQCECQHQYSSKWTFYFETFAIIFISIMGTFIMGKSIIETLNK